MIRASNVVSSEVVKTRKLNLKWVSESIGNDYKKWKPGDIVLISAQTGTGKTYFIKNELLDNLKEDERLLFVCNRTNLKRQLKRDLLTKFGEEVPETLEELDSITTIGEKVTITSYHAISDTYLDEMYSQNNAKCDFSRYDYIVLDECHFILADGSFNNKTRLAYQKLIRECHPHSVRIFISATIHEVREPILRCAEKGFGKKTTIHEYSTGIDYSFVIPKYFKTIQPIINLIMNDKTDNKWLIFISKIEHGNEIIKALGDEICSLIKSGTKDNEELKSIINNSRFEKKVLVCTKAMDNGINIDDPKLKHIVIMAWDQITFIQMLGRKRIDINNPDKVNLYINTRYKKSFVQKLDDLRKKEAEVNLHYLSQDDFNRKYDNDLRNFDWINDLFYRDKDSGYKVNLAGLYRLNKDMEFAQKMINAFENDKEFAFIREQLGWLGLTDSFPKMNLIEDVILDEEVETLEKYLEKIVGQKLFSDEQQELSDLIINELITLSKKTDYRTKKLNPTTIETIIRVQLRLPYAVSKVKKETKGEMRGRRYIVITKLN
jgi:superfamily II DNA or RNA helicase